MVQAVGVKDDGIIGPITLSAVRSANPERVLRHMLAQRLRFMTNLPTWGSFSRGWARRIADLEHRRQRGRLVDTQQ